MANIAGILLLMCLVVPNAHLQEQAEHRDFQYNSVVDPSTGRYNFAYDTGHDNEIAHSLHMQYQDANGIVRGRYGYTDPRGKLRMVEYEAGPNGFVARGDVGPDQFPHGQAPAPTSDSNPDAAPSGGYRTSNDLDLDPAPVQMAGWDPQLNEMDQPPPDAVFVSRLSSVESEDGARLQNEARPDLASLNATSENALELYGPQLGFLNAYPGILPILTNVAANPATENPTLERAMAAGAEPNRPVPANNNAPNVDNIDVRPDDIRQSATTGSTGPTRTTEIGRAELVRRSGDRSARYQPVRVVADHSYVPSRHTHDHDAEVRSRLAHDHYREGRYYRRYYHDHDAERYHNHDHAAERAAYYRRYYRNYPRRIFYRDSHSQEPHEHYDNPVYQNYRAHGNHYHADDHVYGRYRNYVVPATAKPYQVKYIPSDKYHDKVYYWKRD